MPDIAQLATTEKAMWELQTGRELHENKVGPLLNYADGLKEAARAERQAMQQMMAPMQPMRPIEMPAGVADLSELPPLDLTHLFVGINLLEEGLEVDEQQLDQEELAISEKAQTQEIAKDAKLDKDAPTREGKEIEKDKDLDKTREYGKKRTEPGRLTRDGQDKKMEQQIEQMKAHQNLNNPDIRRVQEVAAREEVEVANSNGKITTELRETTKTRSVENSGNMLGKSLGGAALKRENDAFAGKMMSGIANNITLNTHRAVEIKTGSDHLKFEFNPQDKMVYATLNGQKASPEQAINLLKEVSRELGATGRALAEAGIRHGIANPAQRTPVKVDQAIAEHNRAVAAQQTQAIGKVRVAPTK